VRKFVLLLGVGGVGKTTALYRLLGLHNQVRTTLRPGVYRVYYGGQLYEVVDTPGQVAAEVAQAAAKSPVQYFHQAVLMYDLVRRETYEALLDVWSHACIFRGRCISAGRVVVVGNKRDLAEELGYMVEADPDQFGAAEVRYISALKDPAEAVARAVLL